MLSVKLLKAVPVILCCNVKLREKLCVDIIENQVYKYKSI